MFSAKIRHEDRSIIDVEDSDIVTGASWLVRSSDLDTVPAILVPGTIQAQNTYTLSLLESLPEGTWELVKNAASGVKTCYLIWSSPSLVEPAPQEVLDFISWVGVEEAKKLTSLGGDNIDYNQIETAIEQSSLELNYLMSNLGADQQAIYAGNRQHLTRVIARYRLDKICPREFVTKDYESLIKNFSKVSQVTDQGKISFSPVSEGYRTCQPCGCRSVYW